MPATLTVLACSVTANSITITFSDPVDQTSALTLANYSVYDPPVVGAPPPTLNNMPPLTTWTAAPLSSDKQTVTFNATPPLFNPGDYVLIGISGVVASSGDTLVETPTSVSAQIPDTSPTGRITRDVEDAVSYPILTEEIGYRPSPVGLPTSGGGGMAGGGGRSSLGQVAVQAVTDVLGWKANNADPKGFIGALTQAFALTEVEGHVESTWTPRTYAVQTDLGGGISGAQASLYLRAKDALDQSLSLLDGLYPLDPDADPEYVKALREMARSQMTEIVREFGAVGLPSILRIDTYFNILLGQNPAELAQPGPPAPPPVRFDPDQIVGTLGELRDTYGIYFANNPFNNSVADEEDITNFRVISDYMTSLMQSWIANRQFFFLAPNVPAFFGTQLVLISRQFNVIAETVNEVRFALDSVFIGPSERQTLLLEFSDPSLSPMFLEDVLVEVERFVSDEGPRLLRDGGKISVTNNILPVVQSLLNMVEQAHNPTNINQLPDGFQTARVRNSLDDLDDQLEFLINLTEQVEQQVPAPLQKLVLAGVTLLPSPPASPNTLSILGDHIQFGTAVTISSSVPVAVSQEDITFYSAQRIDVVLRPRSLGLEAGHHHITVSNPNGDYTTLLNAFRYDDTTGSVTRGTNPTVQPNRSLAGKAPRAAARRKVASPRRESRHYPAAAAATPRSAVTHSAVAPAPGMDAHYQNLSQQMEAHSRRIARVEATMLDFHASLTAKLEEVSRKLDIQNTAVVEAPSRAPLKTRKTGK